MAQGQSVACWDFEVLVADTVLVVNRGVFLADVITEREANRANHQSGEARWKMKWHTAPNYRGLFAYSLVK